MRDWSLISLALFFDSFFEKKNEGMYVIVSKNVFYFFNGFDSHSNLTAAEARLPRWGLCFDLHLRLLCSSFHTALQVGNSNGDVLYYHLFSKDRMLRNCFQMKSSLPVWGNSLQRLLTPDRCRMERQVSSDAQTSPKTQEELRCFGVLGRLKSASQVILEKSREFLGSWFWNRLGFYRKREYVDFPLQFTWAAFSSLLFLSYFVELWAAKDGAHGVQERRLSYEGENRFWRRLGG